MGKDGNGVSGQILRLDLGGDTVHEVCFAVLFTIFQRCVSLRRRRGTGCMFLTICVLSPSMFSDFQVIISGVSHDLGFCIFTAPSNDYMTILRRLHDRGRRGVCPVH
jgi:hypothetical protein